MRRPDVLTGGRKGIIILKVLIHQKRKICNFFVLFGVPFKPFDAQRGKYRCI